MSLHWGRNGIRGWEPQGGQQKPWKDLAPGDLIEMDRQAWRVREVRPVPVTDWDEDDREHWKRTPRKTGSAEEWPRRPLYLILIPADGGKRHHVRVRPWANWGQDAYVLPEHYPVCKDCGELYPCRELEISAEVARQAGKMAKLEKIIPGCCWACGEPVTHRQKAIRFDGDNLLLPGREPAVFHLRSKCRDGAMRYEKLWIPAGEGRRWRFQCPGRLLQHVDGDECSELGLCPGAVHHPHTDSHVYFRYEYDGPRRTMFREYAGYGLPCLRCTDAMARGENETPYKEEQPPGALL